MSESPWKLLYEKQPDPGKETYAGFLNRSEELVFWDGVWHGDDWVLLDNGNSAFGYMSFPVDLPISIYWRYTSEFSSEVEAKQSLRSFLSDPCDRP